MFEELKAVEEMNLFAIFPIGATIQDDGKRKRSNHISLYHLKNKKREIKSRKIDKKKRKSK